MAVCCAVVSCIDSTLHVCTRRKRKHACVPRCQCLHHSECEQDPIAHSVAIAQRVAVADRISTLQIDERQCIIYGFNKHELQRKPERQRVR